MVEDTKLMGLLNKNKVHKVQNGINSISHLLNRDKGNSYGETND